MALPARPSSGHRRRLVGHRDPHDGGTIHSVRCPPPSSSLFQVPYRMITGLESPSTAAAGHRRRPTTPASLPLLSFSLFLYFPPDTPDILFEPVEPCRFPVGSIRYRVYRSIWQGTENFDSNTRAGVYISNMPNLLYIELKIPKDGDLVKYQLIAQMMERMVL